MTESRALLLIADIGGYTNYMSLHRMSLAHAQANVARLLDAVIDAAPGLELVEIEGDAVFFSGPAEDAASLAAGASLAMHRAFHEEQLRRMQQRLERLEREMREAIQQVHKQYRRDLVLYDPTQLPERKWTSTN